MSPCSRNTGLLNELVETEMDCAGKRQCAKFFKLGHELSSVKAN